MLTYLFLGEVSGIFSNKEDAQSQVSVVVGVYAGITVFSLTVQWFMCMVSASKPLKKDSDQHREEASQSAKEKLRILIGLFFVSHIDKNKCKLIDFVSLLQTMV